MNYTYDFSIITPSYNMLSQLKRCCASVADQTGITVEQIVVDGGSTDGTVEWLKQQQTFQKNLRFISEKDNGMYDAINKGLTLATGRIIAQLNCDEQYLPGTLQDIQSYLAQHPKADVVFGNILLVDPDGKLLSYRKTYQPRLSYILTSHLYIYTCALFYRRAVFDQGHRCNAEQYRIIGDADLIVQMLKHKIRFQHYNKFVSTYTWTDKNLSENPAAVQEKAHFYSSAPAWMKLLTYPLNLARRIEKVISNAYWTPKPIAYQIYTGHNLKTRTPNCTESASWHWPKVINTPG